MFVYTLIASITLDYPLQGWWAALRENDHTVGWIPSAYVEPISEQTAERLRRKTVAKEDVRVQDITERAYTTGALGTEYEYVSPGDAMRAFDWMPVGEHKVCFICSGRWRLD